MGSILRRPSRIRLLFAFYLAAICVIIFVGLAIVYYFCFTKYSHALLLHIYVFTAVKDSNSCHQVRIHNGGVTVVTTELKELHSVRGFWNLHIELPEFICI
jgi:hypothetical protein